MVVVRQTVRGTPSAGLTARACGASALPLQRRRALRRAALALALVAASLGGAPEAQAQLQLQWDAPPGCPQRAEVLERIRAIAGSALDETEGLSAEARITRDQGRVRLELVVRDGREVRRRVIASDSCPALAGAAAITLALLLGADTGSAEPPKDDDLPTAPEPGAPKRPDERDIGPSVSPAVSAEPTDMRRWAVVVRAPGVAADLGLLPRPALGVGVGLGLRYDAWKVVLAGYLFRDQTFNAPQPGEAFGAELQRVTGQLLTCRGWRWSHFEISPCAGLALEHVTARGFGVGVSPQARRAVWLAPGAGAVAHWYALKSWAFFTEITGYLELSRPRLVIQDLGGIRQLGPASIGAAVGFEWIL
jgi:hypothetical protein